MDFSELSIVYCRCTCHRHTLIFSVRRTWSPPIGAREIDGLLKVSMAELLVIHVIGSGEISQIWRQSL